MRAAGASGSSARARDRPPDVALATQSDSAAAAAVVRGAERAEQVRQTRGAGRRAQGSGRRVGRVGSLRHIGLGVRLGVQSVHTRLHRDSPSTWLPGSRRRRGLEIFRGKMATTAFSFGTSLEGKRELVLGDSGPGMGVSVESEHSRFGFEAGLCQVALCHVAACS